MLTKLVVAKRRVKVQPKMGHNRGRLRGEKNAHRTHQRSLLDFSSQQHRHRARYRRLRAARFAAARALSCALRHAVAADPDRGAAEDRSVAQSPLGHRSHGRAAARVQPDRGASGGVFEHTTVARPGDFSRRWVVSRKRGSRPRWWRRGASARSRLRRSCLGSAVTYSEPRSTSRGARGARVQRLCCAPRACGARRG